jgi:hypothetical protein
MFACIAYCVIFHCVYAIHFKLRVTSLGQTSDAMAPQSLILSSILSLFLPKMFCPNIAILIHRQTRSKYMEIILSLDSIC